MYIKVKAKVTIDTRIHSHDNNEGLGKIGNIDIDFLIINFETCKRRVYKTVYMALKSSVHLRNIF